MIKIAIEDWQSDMMTSFATGKRRLAKAKQ